MLFNVGTAAYSAFYTKELDIVDSYFIPVQFLASAIGKCVDPLESQQRSHPALLPLSGWSPR